MCTIKSSLVASKEGKLHVWFCVVSWQFVLTMVKPPTHLPTTRPQPTAPAHHRKTGPQRYTVSPPTRFPPRDFHGQNPPKPIRLDDIADQDETLTNDRNIPMWFPTRQTAHPCGWHMMLLSFYHQSDHKVNGNRLLAAWQFPTWSSNGWYDGNDRNASKHHQNSIKTQKLPAQLSAKQTSVLICTVNIYISNI